MKSRSTSLGLTLVAVLVLAACAAPAIRPTSTLLPVMADAFFSGRAFVDTNDNSQIDPTDPLLKGAVLTVTDARGASSGGITDDQGRATAWFPGGGVQYPVTIRMKPPKDSAYAVIGPSEVVLQKGTSADFLFALPPK
jgi:hypothetical protein